MTYYIYRQLRATYDVCMRALDQVKEDHDSIVRLINIEHDHMDHIHQLLCRSPFQSDLLRYLDISRSILKEYNNVLRDAQYRRRGLLICLRKSKGMIRLLYNDGKIGLPANVIFA